MKRIIIIITIFALFIVQNANARTSIRDGGYYPPHYDVVPNDNTANTEQAKNIALFALFVAVLSVAITVVSASGHNSTGDTGYDNYLNQKGKL